MNAVLIGISFFISVPLCLFGQERVCDYYVTSLHPHRQKEVKQSVYPLQFSVSENIDVALTFSALEASNRLDLSLDFDSRSGLPVEPGSTLTITLTDGSDYAAISHSKKARTGIIYFTLFKSASGQPLNPEEKSLKAKLTTLEIKSLKVIADDKQRMIQIPDTKAAIIKTTIQCLLHSSTRK